MQSCPCGMKDCYPEYTAESKSNVYLRMGEPNLDFANNGLFEECANILLPPDALFQFENRAEMFNGNTDFNIHSPLVYTLEIYDNINYYFQRR